MQEDTNIRNHLDEIEATWKKRFERLHDDEALDAFTGMMRDVRQCVDLILIALERNGHVATQEDAGFLVKELRDNVTVAAAAPPHLFTGHASINGQKAPDGVIVEASIDGAIRGSSTVMKGFYTMAVEQGSSGRVLFFVDGIPTVVVGEWMMGGASMMNLDATRTWETT